ncbi:MAG: septum formation initiator family protein [Paludibacteraceae bacterium]|nr:septum formation initiator family protein [Paludibacteraceae bacterium]
MKSFFQRNDSPTSQRPKWVRWVFNKYVIVIVVFLLILMFSGEKSLISSFERSCKIRQAEAQIERTRKQIEECNREIRTMGNTDSLERFARENYYMHTDNEDVYLIGR